MPLIDWIKGHQFLVGTFVICILLVIVSVVVFLIIRSIRRRLAGGQSFDESVASLDVPPKPPADLEVYPKPPRISISVLKKIWKFKKPGMEAIKMKTKKIKPAAVGEIPAAPAVDINSLTVEQLEQLLKEKRAAAVVETKRATLMAMSQEELVQLIIDNRIEI